MAETWNDKGVCLGEVVAALRLQVPYLPKDGGNVRISKSSVKQAGLCLAGFFEGFAECEVYLFGNEEMHYLRSALPDARATMLDVFFCHRPLLVVVTDNCELLPELVLAASKYGVAYARAKEPASFVLLKALEFLASKLASLVSLHGELMVIYGEGVLLTGDSGIGKSETAIELIRRGHHLVADDLVDLRRIAHDTLTGAAPSNIRYFVELRGIGIVNVKKMFGNDAVKMSSQIDLVVEMLDVEGQPLAGGSITAGGETTNILGLEIPIVKIPVKNGRNMTTLVEAATMANKQKKAGYDAGVALLHGLKASYGGQG
ncbi:MAG: HPr(Ser) kinase/phosphatase [Oscillospiraceae bacterium]|nr:HPr(Ser) kinase/phosphatase [Oscillospiraceae bacterium]